MSLADKIKRKKNEQKIYQAVQDVFGDGENDRALAQTLKDSGFGAEETVDALKYLHGDESAVSEDDMRAAMHRTEMADTMIAQIAEQLKGEKQLLDQLDMRLQTTLSVSLLDELMDFSLYYTVLSLNETDVLERFGQAACGIYGYAFGKNDIEGMIDTRKLRDVYDTRFLDSDLKQKILQHFHGQRQFAKTFARVALEGDVSAAAFISAGIIASVYSLMGLNKYSPNAVAAQIAYNFLASNFGALRSLITDQELSALFAQQLMPVLKIAEGRMKNALS